MLGPRPSRQSFGCSQRRLGVCLRSSVLLGLSFCLTSDGFFLVLCFSSLVKHPVQLNSRYQDSLADSQGWYLPGKACLIYTISTEIKQLGRLCDFIREAFAIQFALPFRGITHSGYTS